MVVAAAGVRRAGKALATEHDQVLVLTSVDGRAWETASGSPLSRSFVTALATGPGGVLAAGGLSPPAGAGGHAFATFSAGATGTWEADEVLPLPGDGPDERGSRNLVALAVGGDRVVAAGTAFVGNGPGGHADGVVFVREGDGPFRPVPGVPGMAGPEDEFVHAGCAGPAGFLVLGSVRRGVDRRAAAWFSADGESWREVHAAPLTSRGNTISDCVVVDRGVIAVGTRSGDAGDDDAAVWTSPDGLTWTAVESPIFGGDEAQYLLDVAADGTAAGVVAVGGDGRSGENEILLWRSEDAGATWDRVDTAALRGRRSQHAGAVVVAAGRLVVGGIADHEPAVWSRPWPR